MKLKLCKKLFTLALVVVLAVCAAACQKNTAQETSKDDSLFETATSGAAESTTENETTFKDANILSFELVTRDDESYDDIISHFKITNNGKKAVDYCSVDYAYYDKDKNVICDDSRYLDFQIAAGKSAMARSYSDLDDGYKKSDIKYIEVTSYTYYCEEVAYDVDLESESVNTYEHKKSADLEFDKANILTFEYDDKGINSINSYEVGIKVHNNGSKKVVYCDIEMAYLDKDGMFLEKDGRYNDKGFDVGKFTSIDSYMTEETFAKDVKSFGVYEYEYTLIEDDEKGNNHYTVNLQTKEVTGTHKDK